jgi:hypothetical protein
VKGIGTFVLILLVGLGVATYLYTRPPERGVTAAELSWIRDYVGWSTKTEDQVTSAYTGSSSASADRNARALEPLRSCFDSLARDVGAAPDLLRPVEQAAQGACGEAQFALDLNDEYGLASIASTKQHLQRAEESLELAAGRVDDRLVIGKTLESKEGPGDGSREDPELSAAATRVTGQTMDVRCWSDADWFEVRTELRALDVRHRDLSAYSNVAGVWRRTISLASSTCKELGSLAEVDASASSDAQVEALVILGHEAAHAAGTGDELAAECHALQYVRGMALELRASSALANTLAGRSWELYRARELHPQLWSASCRNGRSLDLRAGDIWP